MVLATILIRLSLIRCDIRRLTQIFAEKNEVRDKWVMLLWYCRNAISLLWECCYLNLFVAECQMSQVIAILSHTSSSQLESTFGLSEGGSVHFWVFRSHLESLQKTLGPILSLCTHEFRFQTDKSDKDFGRFMSYVWDIKPLMKLNPKKCKIRHSAQIWAPKKEARRGWKSWHRERKREARDKWGMFLFKLQCNVAMRQMSRLIAKLSHKI